MVNTDPKKIDELLSRGVEEVIDMKDLREKLLSGKQLRIKLGIDPTSPNLHLGRAIQILKLKDFQDLGHKAVLIVGDFTGLIGDTSDKDAERPMLEVKTIKENLKTYKEQVGKILNLSKSEFYFNSKWLSKLSFAEINDLASVFSLNSFIQRDIIRRRLVAGKRVSLREVLYPIMQGYDSVKVEADVEIGGTDQKFNLLAGRDLQKKFGQREQNIVMGPIVEGTDGRKMSSSWGNTINLLDNPVDMYGKVMSIRDDLIIRYFELMTRTSREAIREYEKKIKSGENPKKIKQDLALEIVRMYHGEEEARNAQNNWEETFSKGGIPSDIEEVVISSGMKLKNILVESGIVESNSEFLRLLKAGAIKDASPQHKEDQKVTEDISVTKNYVLKIGKRRFLKIIVK